MPGCTPWRMPTWPADGHRGREGLVLAQAVRALAQPVVEEGHVAGAQSVAQDGLREAVDLEDDETRARADHRCRRRHAGHALHRVAEERLVLVEADDGHEHGVDGGDEDRRDEGEEEAVDGDAVDDPAGAEQRQAHEDDRQHAGDDDVVDAERHEHDRPQDERDDTGHERHQRRRRDVLPEPATEGDAVHQLGHDQQRDGVDDEHGKAAHHQVALAARPVHGRVVLVLPDRSDAMEEPGLLRLGSQTLFELGAFELRALVGFRFLRRGGRGVGQVRRVAHDQTVCVQRSGAGNAVPGSVGAGVEDGPPPAASSGASWSRLGMRAPRPSR